ncbi:MAG: hypothetical protein R3E89_08140 [Thiolinea sp.]
MGWPPGLLALGWSMAGLLAVDVVWAQGQGKALGVDRQRWMGTGRRRQAAAVPRDLFIGPGRSGYINTANGLLREYGKPDGLQGQANLREPGADGTACTRGGLTTRRRL